jgi:hypothetical protein
MEKVQETERAMWFHLRHTRLLQRLRARCVSFQRLIQNQYLCLTSSHLHSSDDIKVRFTVWLQAPRPVLIAPLLPMNCDCCVFVITMQALGMLLRKPQQVSVLRLESVDLSVPSRAFALA